MKALKPLTAALCMAAGVLLSGCSDDKDSHLLLSETSCAFGASGGDRTIAVTADGFDWRAETEGDDADWFTVTKVSGGIQIHAPQNTSQAIKRASVVIEGTIRATIDVVQEFAEAPSLSLTPTDKQFGLTSDGGSVTLSVRSNYPWTAESDSAWCATKTDPKAGTLTLSAGRNDGAQRTARITVSTGPSYAPQSVVLTLTQYTAAENPYLAAVGRWELYSEQWSYDGQSVGPGAFASCEISQNVVNDSYIVKDLILPGTEVEAYFNPDDGSIGIPLGGLVGMTGEYPCYLVQVNMTTGRVEPGYVNGAFSSDRNTIAFSGFGTGFGLGIVTVVNGNIARFKDLPYATGQQIEFRRPAGEQQAASGFAIPDRRSVRTKAAPLAGGVLLPAATACRSSQDEPNR